MTSNLKALAFAVVFACASVPSSQAVAAAEFHCTNNTSGSCVYTGTTENTESEGVHEEFIITGGEPFVIKCHGTLQATAPQTTTQLTASTHYSNCTNGEVVTTNHCATLLNAGTDANGDAAVSTECEVGSATTIDIPGICTLSVGAQAPSGGLHYNNLANGTLTIDTTVTGITYAKSNATGNQLFCALISGSMTHRGKTATTCYEDTGSALSDTSKTTPTGLTSEGATKTCHRM
jgi:hypothetical protein